MEILASVYRGLQQLWLYISQKRTKKEEDSRGPGRKLTRCRRRGSGGVFERAIKG
jgi:hypothetical protein